VKLVLFITHINIGIVVQKEAFALPFFMAARKAKWAWAWRAGHFQQSHFKSLFSCKISSKKWLLILAFFLQH